MTIIIKIDAGFSGEMQLFREAMKQYIKTIPLPTSKKWTVSVTRVECKVEEIKGK